MIIRPAIDIRDGQCVQLVGGSYENELVRLPDPLVVRDDWISKGFSNLHIIDLDRATLRGTNEALIKEICLKSLDADESLDFRVGGGIRSEEDIASLLNSCASSVVVGTKALKDPDWLKEVAYKFEGKVFVAVEVFEDKVKVSGWEQDFDASMEELLKTLSLEQPAGVFITAIHREGRCQGTDVELFKKARDLVDGKVIASGGITTMGDIDQLEAVGIDEVVLGAAIYTDKQLVQDLQEYIKNRRKTRS